MYDVRLVAGQHYVNDLVLELHSDVASFTAGRITEFASNWRKSDTWIVSTLRGADIALIELP